MVYKVMIKNWIDHTLREAFVQEEYLKTFLQKEIERYGKEKINHDYIHFDIIPQI